MRYINSDIYKIIKDNSELTFEEKKLPDALSKLDETNPVKQYLRDTNIIDTASERNQPIELELNHWCLNPSLKYYFKDHEEDTMVTRKDLGLLIVKENNIVEFQKGFNALIEKGKDKDGQSKRLNNLIMGKQLLLANELKSSSTEPFPFVGNLPEIWLLAIANLDESHDNIFGVFLYDTRIVSKQGCSISPFSLIWLSPLLKDFDNKLSLKVLYEIYSVAQEKHDDEVLKKINAYVENKENQDYLCEASCNIDLTYAIQFVCQRSEGLKNNISDFDNFTQFMLWRIQLAIKSDIKCFKTLLQLSINSNGSTTKYLKLFVSESIYNNFCTRAEMSLDNFAQREYKNLLDATKPSFINS